MFRILFLPTINTPVAYYRMASYAKYMNKQPGVMAVMYQYDPKKQVSVRWESEAAEDNGMRLQLANLVDSADIVVHQTLHNQYSFSLAMCMREEYGAPFVLDLDDYRFNIPTYNPAGVAHQPNTDLESLMRFQVELAQMIVASTPWLADKTEDINTAVCVVPNTIDFGVWDKLNPPRPHKRIRIGWAGASTHTDDLRLLIEPMHEILKRHPDVEFVCLGGAPDFFKNKTRIIPKVMWYPINKYPQGLASQGFDIGIAPLLDNEFNRAKSNLRWLEYSALGIPTVASAVEPFNRSISHGKTGYLVSNDPEEWVKRLDTLITNEKKRHRMGEAAQAKVRRNYNTAKTTKEYLQLLKGLVK